MNKKLKTYKVYTTFTGGWEYTIKAKSKRDAEENWYDCEWVSDEMDSGWCGDSQEEVNRVEEVKTK